MLVFYFLSCYIFVCFFGAGGDYIYIYIYIYIFKFYSSKLKHKLPVAAVPQTVWQLPATFAFAKIHQSNSYLQLVCLLNPTRVFYKFLLYRKLTFLFPLQVCGRGFFLSEQSECLPCNCKGHADYCEDITGICINCKYHSMGDFCEMCEDGYILTPGLGGRHTCQPCACPLPIPSNNFAVHCDKGGATPRCKCQEGYSGNYCERCAPGYYGSPMTTGSSCKRCDCNGNTDPNLIFNECHNVTGHCQHCWGNTAGANCERCTPGFYGDAISAKDCRECDCESGFCDMHTGGCLAESSTVNLCNISKSCDQCIWHLIKDMEHSNKTLDQLKVGVLNITTGAAANDRVKYYNYTAHQLQVHAHLYLNHTVSPRDLRKSDANGIRLLHSTFYQSLLFFFIHLSFRPPVGSMRMENLNLLVPTLLDKLKVVEDKKPVNNVTTNIMRIRELIAQARSVAKKVQVSMKFNGQSSVEVHPHSNLEELKTMTSISLFMRVDPDKDPIEDRIILYLGDRNGVKDYMGLATKNDILVFVYKLGGEDIEIPLSSKPVSQWPAVFNYVKIERLGRHGKVFLTVPSQSSTDEQKFIQKGEAPGTESLFDIDPQDLVFFVGGVPPDVKLPPPLILAPFVGCIELSSMNNDVISLYNFKQTHKINVTTSPPCPRYKLAFSQSRIASYLFDGKGYALISNIERRGTFNAVTRFDISVRTIASDGVLFLMVNEDKFFLLELKNGILRLMYDFGFSNGPKLLENNLAKLQINDAKYHEVSVIYHQSKKVILLVDKSHVKSMENPKTTLPFADIYIGGAPSSILKSRPELSSVVGLKGCVKGFQFQRKDFNLLEEPGTIGISSGCPEESFMSRKAYFSGKSYLGSTAKISPFDNFEGGLNFRTLQPSGLLFYHNEGSDEFSISLENGAVVLNNRGVKVKSHKKQYNDGSSHFLLASVNNQKLDRDIEPEDFKRYPEKVQISLEGCPVQRPPAALLLRHRANTSGTKQSQKVKDKSSLPPVLTELGSDDQESAEPNIKSCFLSSSPKSIHHAFRFSSIANSRQHYTDFPDSLSQRSHFSLSMKTHSSFGLIFYVSDAQEDNFMALFLAHGKLVYTFSVGDQKVKIKSEDKYNDGAWHSVIFIRDGNVGRLIVDGLTMLEDSVQGNNVSWHISSPLYVGGVPAGRAQKNIQRNSAYSFTGCIKNLQLDRKQLSSVADTFGVTPCFDGVSEGGTYFSEEGGYIVLDDSFNLGPRFELVMEVRPRVASGVLLHVHSADDYFTVYIHQGAVVVLVNDGTREFFTKVSPKQGVCSGSWHKITVIRDANVVQLDVDSEINHVVGPLSPSSTDSRKPVFIGGTPESAATRKAFVGCMRNLTINNSQVNFSKAVLVSGAVSVGTCPAT
uniref:Laminin subunit alpha 4 n=1 Tax=Astatotilapia calliptera TaxID=8154 RepID=A0AAX7U8W2_ASTCA